FPPDPFRPEAGGRLFKTGDLGRFDADGVIEYLGRLDRQVKVRGNRVELGEVEGALTAHPDVREAVVVGRKEALVGYVVPSAHRPTERALRAFLRQTLPEYMVPSRIVFLDAFPLTPNGKVDVLALPEPTRQRGEVEFEEPQGEVAQTLAGIWS